MMTTHRSHHTQACQPGEALLNTVRGAFVSRGTSLTAWCDANAVSRTYARWALLGLRDGPKAKALRARLVEAAHGR